jgi:putative NADH-flavin reductase
MRIAVIGGTGWLGGHVAEEARRRGHEVKAMGRADANALDPSSVAEAVRGSDAVVSAVTDRSTDDRSVIPGSARALVEGLPAAGVDRLLFMGGGGSLEVKPGVRVVDMPGFPPEHRAEALAQAEALQILRRDGSALRWSYLSPPPKDLVPGEATRSYRVQGGDTPVVNERGESRITAGDLASAAVDELERPQFVGQRFTAGS